MSTLRLVQNFHGMRALVATAVPEPSGSTLTMVLERLGLEVVALHSPAAMPAGLQPERDVMVVDGDLDLALLQWGDGHAPVPVIGLVGIEAPGRLRALTQLGATAFLRKPVHGSAVYSALYLGVNAHRQRRQAEDRIAEHERRWRGRRYVIKAILHLMRSQNLDDDAAYEVLRRVAMQSRLGIEDYCEAWLRREAAAPDAAAGRINDLIINEG